MSVLLQALNIDHHKKQGRHRCTASSLPEKKLPASERVGSSSVKQGSGISPARSTLDARLNKIHPEWNAIGASISLQTVS